MAKERILTTVVNMAGNVEPSVKKGFDTVEKRLQGINKTAVAVTASIAAVGVGIAAAGTKAAAAMLEIGDGFNKSMNQLQAQTGATAAEMEELSEIAQSIYKNNYGENMGDVTASIAEVQKITQLMDDDLKAVTEGALTLRDTFGYDVTESARAAKAMMTNFGISGEEALSMIAAGSQNGLDYSGELIDSINEYSVQFQKLGFTADDMFNIFQQGADSGAWNLDKVGDAIKEFSIRAIDGSKTTIDAYTQLGYNAEEVMGIFAKGGDDASDAFQIILKDLMNVKDEVKRDAIGVELFGTMWEDLGTEAVSALMNIDGGLYDTNDALKGIQAIQFDDLGSAMQGIKRQIETGLIPASSGFAKQIQERFPEIQQTIQDVMPFVEDLSVKFADTLVVGIDAAAGAVQWFSENSDTLIPILQGVAATVATFSTVKMVTGIYSAVTAFGALSIARMKEKAETAYLMALYAKDAIAKGTSTAATIAQTVATGAWNVTAGIATGITTALGAAFAFLTSPIGLVILAIAAVVAIGVLLYKNWDVIKEKAAQLGQFISGIWSGMKETVSNLTTQLWEFLSGVWENIKQSVSGLVGGIKDMFVSGFSALAGLLKAPINGVIGLINGAINRINGIGFDIPEWVPVIGGKKFSVNIPNLPLLAKGGFTNGVSIAGEAGTEAVISFDRSVRSENIEYWEKAGKMLGVSPIKNIINSVEIPEAISHETNENNIFEISMLESGVSFAKKVSLMLGALSDSSAPLLDSGNNGSGGNGGGGVKIEKIEFSPKIEITGTTDKESIMAAIEAEYPEFIDLLERWFMERGYFAFG